MNTKKDFAIGTLKEKIFIFNIIPNSDAIAFRRPVAIIKAV